MAAFSCDSRPAGGGQLLKHCGSCSSSGVSQFLVRVWAKHRLFGKSVLAVTEQIVSLGAAHVQPPVPPVRTTPDPPLGYGPTGAPPLNPGALNLPMNEKSFTDPPAYGRQPLWLR